MKRIAWAIARAMAENASMIRAMPIIVVMASFLSGCIISQRDFSLEIASVSPLLPGDYIEVRTGTIWNLSYNAGRYLIYNGKGKTAFFGL